MAFEYWPRVPLMQTAVPAVYERIAREPATFAILDVPPGVRDGSRVLGRSDAERLLAQTVHHKPIVDGMASRLSDWRWGSIVSAPLVGSLLESRADGPSLARPSGGLLHAMADPRHRPPPGGDA